MKKIFYSNGKLLLTGEYAVLDGARALALPTRFGQYLEVEPYKNNLLHWTSKDADGSVWLDETIRIDGSGKWLPTNETPEATRLIQILEAAHKSNPDILATGGYKVTTRLTFPRGWGLGSSSTLINNIAKWFGADPYALLAESFGGSGYDIACAKHNTPIIYRNDHGTPQVEPATFNPAFTDKLYFVYLNRKQDSREGITAYRTRENDTDAIIPHIDELTQEVLKATSLSDFCMALEIHEKLMSEILGMPTVKEILFPDFPGTLKSLGAWGGDFILAASGENPEAYFRSRNFETVIPYREMILEGDPTP